jgi:hypothetical protein
MCIRHGLSGNGMWMKIWMDGGDITGKLGDEKTVICLSVSVYHKWL